MNSWLIFFWGLIIGAALTIFVLWLLSDKDPPEAPTQTRRYHLVTLDQLHEIILTFPALPREPYRKLCLQVIRRRPLDYRTVEKACGISKEDYRIVRDTIKRRFPEAFGKKDVLTPTPPIIEFFLTELRNLGTEQNERY